jgi:hypothetical protein
VQQTLNAIFSKLFIIAPPCFQSAQNLNRDMQQSSEIKLKMLLLQIKKKTDTEVS